MHVPECNYGLNYIFKNGFKTNMPYFFDTDSEYVPVRTDAAVATVQVYGSRQDHHLCGIKFFDRDDREILKAGYCKRVKDNVYREFTLRETERLVGVKSRSTPNLDFSP